MLYILSLKYQKEIALSLFSLFFITTLTQAETNVYRYSVYENRMPAVHYRTHSVFRPSISADIRSTSSTAAAVAAVPVSAHTGKPVTVSAVHKPEKGTIGGPSQPEMSTFKSVGTDNMVNLFTGNFSYNIPLLDVGGYPVNIFYSSGIAMDQEASWVGLGWNINPGSITRTMRGIPDDFDGTDVIKKTQSIRPDETYGVNAGAIAQLAGFPLQLGVNMGVSINNRLGIATEFGVSTDMNLSTKGGDYKTSSLNPGYGLKLGLSLNLSSRTGANITPSVGLAYSNTNSAAGGDYGVGASASVGYNSRMGLQAMHVSAEAYSLKYNADKSTAEKDVYDKGDHSGSVDGSFSFAYPSVIPSISMPLTHLSLSGNLTFGVELFGLHPNITLGGFYTKAYLAEEDKVKFSPAYGMMYLQKGNNDPNALLDFNRIQDRAYTKFSSTIGMPTYSYDVYSISGEGTGGQFKAYRGDIGYVHDQFTETREDAASVGVELGAGNGVHGGVNFNYVYTPTTAGAWDVGNFAKSSFSFKDSSGVNQAVYFKNPGEKAIPDVAYQSALGGEDLVRLHLNPGSQGQATLTPTLESINPGNNAVLSTHTIAQNFIKKRDKRTQVISCLTAAEATDVALDTAIYSYNPDTSKIVFGTCEANSDITSMHRVGGYRKGNHISEINVWQNDGKKYVYGIPVYNTKQTDVTMAIKGDGNKDTSLVAYSAQDDSPGNTNGTDYYYEKQEMPAYVNSYLLTALVSPNYVDLTGDGITDDDMGDAIKFNYSKSDESFKWRTPSNNASYSVGLRTDPEDDKAHYIYGEREQWYLYSIESKNMVARFYVSDRQDGRAVNGPAGGIAGSGNKKLDKIALYSKGDLLRQQRTGIKAKPIKTVYFVYSYELCPDPTGRLTNNGTGTGAGQNGKLTLKSIYFTYNGNEKQHKNKYAFHYPSDNNPDYSYTSNDRWGNYKPTKDEQGASLNPGGLSNAEYPYVIQDSAKAAQYAAAWTLDSITIPSGGKIGITYESDDYAYVQDRRAASMTSILGFGYQPDPQDDAALHNQKLYDYGPSGGFRENNYVYIQLPVPVDAHPGQSQKNELMARYFADINQLFMKVAVNMPADQDGSNAGYEQIPIYADIDSVGLVPGATDKAFVRVKIMESGHTPMVQYALQFMKSFLPGKAYPGYNQSKTGGFKAIFQALAGTFASFSELVNGEDKNFMSAAKCKTAETDKSFVRLSNPAGKKLGGGLRVKRIVIHDNWNKMTGQYEATYGQEYTYTTTETINNAPVTISSGVASWEPVVGGEENPHREIIRDLSRQKAGPFDYTSVELPMGEMFYPSPSVGYSRVEVNSIHRDTVRNAPGKTVTEYYTTRDFPFASSFTQLPGPSTQEFSPSPILKILHADLVERITVSQGFKVDLNDMDGREKSQATYSSLDPDHFISKTTNYYSTVQQTDKTFGLNHTFSVINGPDGTVDTNGVIGRDVELMADFREHQSHTYNANINTNIDFFWIGWFPVPLINPLSPFYVDETTYRSAAVTKVVNHYGVLDSVVVIDKGSTVSTKNLVYDAETGEVLLSRTNNEHGLPLYNFNYPAHWAYSGMDAAYKNIDVRLNHLTFVKGLLTTPVDTSIFESGDEIYIESSSLHGPEKMEPCDIFSCTDPYLPKNNAKKIWAVNTGKQGGVTPHLVFMDEKGAPYTATDAAIRIIRSGHRNMLNQAVGSITTLYNPMDAHGRLVFNDNTGILHTTAATFKDDWRVDDLLYKTDSAYTTIDTVTRISFMDTAHQVMTVTRYDSPYDDKSEQADSATTTSSGSDTTLYYGLSANQYATHSSLRLNTVNDYLTRKTWIRFDKIADSILKYGLDTSCLATSPVTFYATAHDNSISDCDEHDFSHPGAGMNADSVIHQGSGLHGGWVSFNEDGSYYGNTSIVQLMRGQWPAGNDQARWGNAFEDLDDYADNYALSVRKASPGIWNATGDEINVRNVLQQMMLQHQIDSTVEPALAFQLYQQSPVVGEQNIKCWNDANTNCIYQKPAIEFTYFPCKNGGKLVSVTNDTIGYCSIVSYKPTACRSLFATKTVNPYMKGILGNWRTDSVYVYYGTRKENDPSVPVDTRTAGTITGYKGFWNFNADILQRNYSASDVWVWNSTITQYNHKGYEVENKDPLGRYNSGIYGYNQQLPVAVTNNASLRETMFDGFEDYDYQTSTCALCKPHRHVDFGEITSNIVSEQRHSGQYSLKVEAGQWLGFTAPVVAPASVDSNYGIRIKIDTAYVEDTIVTGKGSGLTGTYYNISRYYKCCRHSTGFLAGETGANADAAFGRGTGGFTASHQSLEYTSNAAFDAAIPAGITDKTVFATRWTGYLQPTTGGVHSFRIAADDGYRFTIIVNGVPVVLANRWTNSDWPAFSTIQQVTLQKGQLYQVVIDYLQYAGDRKLEVQWKEGSCGAWMDIPAGQLYDASQVKVAGGVTQTTDTTVRYPVVICTHLDTVQVTGRALTDTFSLIQGHRMIIGAWVKEGGNDCKCSTYVNNTISVTFAGATDSFSLKPSGNIIEGWQRYEGDVTIPLTATSVSVKLNNQSATSPVYFDDIRVHPYNANMKSFVYNSSTLRLMAELDENNYASFYEYDDDGTLTRVKKETIKGIQTITETRSALQKVE